MHRKDLVQMILTIGVIVAGFFVVQYFFFPNKPPANPPVKSSNTPAANAPAGNAPASNQPPGEMKDATPSTQTETRPTTATEDRGFVRIRRKEARTYTLANSKLTAVISERGASLESLKFVDRDGKTVFLRTPNDPTLDASEPLELIAPLAAAEFAAPLALRMDDNDQWRNLSRWELVDGPGGADGAKSLTFRFPPASYHRESDDTVIFKTITLHPDTFRMDIDLRVENHSGKIVDKTVGLWGAAAITNDGTKLGAEHARVALYGSTASKTYTSLHDSPTISGMQKAINSINEDRVDDGKKPLERVDNRTLDEMESKPEQYLLAHGMRTLYFLCFLSADPMQRDARWSGEVLPLKELNDAATSLIAPPLQIDPVKDGKPGEATIHMSFYAGPRDKDVLEAAWFARPLTDDDLRVEWRDLAPSGFPAFISAPFIWVLRQLTGLVGPGFAIILLTLIVRTLLSPLSYRGQKSMAIYTAKMKVVKPKLDKIKEKYAGKKDRDSQMKMLTETREAMREHNVGMLPLGGCLPMLIQLPIFIGLYRAFGNAFFMRQGSFLWISDLSMPDATIPWSVQATFLPGFMQGFLTHNGFFTINLLPMIWIALSLLQMRMQPKPDDPQQAAMQKQMGCIFPLMGLMFYGFASGFAFYFIFSSLYSLAESKLIKRNLIKLGITKPPAKNKPRPDDKPEYHASA